MFTKLKNCAMCDKCLVGRQQKFCCGKCKSKFNNYHVNDGEGCKTYHIQKAEGYRRKKKFIDDKGGGCQLCGYNKSYRALTFHHRNPTIKKFQLDIRNLSNRSYDKCLLEVEKCDLLCFNCHMELHDEENGGSGGN